LPHFVKYFFGKRRNSMRDLPTVELLGLSYASLTPDALCEQLQKQLCCGQKPIKVFTPNVTIAAAAHRDPALHQLLCTADLLLPDGQGVLLAARLAGTPLPCRLPGIEAGESVLRLCAAQKLPVYFLGAAPGIAEKAATAWKMRLPSLPIAGTHHGYFDVQKSDAILADIRQSGARVVLVCLGFPAQERWIAEHADCLPEVKILMGLGGSFDVWAGENRRAPRIFQRLGLEWLWRTVQRPTRLRTLFPAFSYLFAAAKSKKAQNPVKIQQKIQSR
jgi:N-acetylglucosaminyldiphosphoundecaprenol N-acetyl-beta-D-mannosaminyltransferase